MYLNKQNFENQFSALMPNYDETHFLLAVSGGSDSMVLANLFNDLHLNFQVAHVNYKLRGEDSDLDEKVVRDFCAKNDIKFHLHSVSKKDNKPKNSIQIWARTLRYNFFDKIKYEENLKHLVTAHHLNDELETFIINLSRASGLKGLRGIPRDKNDILRPLLKFKKDEIYRFAEEFNIEFREDKSNQKTDYLRNFIRNEITPKLLETNEHFLENFSKTLNYLKETEDFVEAQIQEKINFLSKLTAGKIIFNKEKIGNETAFVKHQILKKYGFKDELEIEKIFKSENGSQFFSHENRIKVTATELIINVLNEEKIDFKPIIISKSDKIRIKDFCVNYEEVEKVWNINSEKINWPVKIRMPESGDLFNPFGMKGKKKVKKFIKDLKLTASSPEIFVLVDSKEQILGVLPFRQNGNFLAEKESATYKIYV